MWELKCTSPPTTFPPTLTFPLNLRNQTHFNHTPQHRRFPSLSVNCRATTAQMPPIMSDDRMLVFVPPHPLIKHWVSVLRNEQTPCAVFKNAMGELGRLLMYEASRDWLPTIAGEIQTPMAVAEVEFVDPREPVAVIPVLRAGLALAEHAASILPSTMTYHLGLARDEETLQPTVYLNKLPEKFPEGARILVVDPMLATGLLATTEHVKNRIKVWKKHHSVITDIRTYTKFKWDDDKKMLVIPIEDHEEWSAYCKVNPVASAYRNKNIDHWDEICTLFAMDRATGQEAEQHEEYEANSGERK